jgi:hypothetical protein
VRGHKVEARSVISRLTIILVIVFSMTWVGSNSLYPLPHVDRIFYFENIPHHEVLVTAQTVRSEKFTLWPVSSSLPLDSWTSETMSSHTLFPAEDGNTGKRGFLREWVVAFSVGALSISLGLTLIFASGVRLSWLSVRF